MRCSKCGKEISDDIIIAWKCNSCGKALKGMKSQLQNLLIKKKLNSQKPLLKCPTCKNDLDDGNERIFWKCSCGNVNEGKLKEFEEEIENSPNNNLIKCSQCGREISNKAKRCVHCGKVFSQEQSETSICSDCGKEIPKNAVECPICGCPQNNNSVHNNTQSTAPLILKIIIVVVFLLLISICMLVYMHQEKEQDSGEEPNEKEEIEFDIFDMSMQSEKSAIEGIANDFFMNLQNGNWEETQQYLTEKYNYLEHNPFGLSTESNLKKLFENYSYTLINSTVDDEDDVAFIDIEVSHPDYMQLLNAGIANFNFEEDNCIENGFMNKLDDSALEYQITNGSLNLVKENGEWKIKIDDFFDSCIYYGISEESSFDKIAENEKKHAEENLYINEMIDLVDYRIGMMETYSGKVLGINNISIKNNGDKQIDSLTLNIDFFDEGGKKLLSKEITVLGIWDQSISAGYSWKMDNDKFFEIENVPSDVDFNRAIASIKEVQLSDPKTFEKPTPEEEYIEEYIEITNYYIGMQNGYRGREPGLSDVSIKNNGDKNISQLTITVFFQDDNGKNIAEDSFMLIGGLWGGDTLKANYSWKMESNSYYEFENLADEVDISRNSVVITSIRFE